MVFIQLGKMPISFDSKGACALRDDTGFDAELIG